MTQPSNNPQGRAAPGVTSQPRPTTVAEVQELTTIPVWSQREPNAAGLFQPPLGRDNAYRLAGRGQLPGVLMMGSRYYVAVRPLLEALGLTTEVSARDN